MFLLRFLQAWVLSAVGMVPASLLPKNRGATYWVALVLYFALGLTRWVEFRHGSDTMAGFLLVLLLLSFNMMAMTIVLTRVSPASGLRYVIALLLCWSFTDAVSLLSPYEITGIYDWSLAALYVVRSLAAESSQGNRDV